MLWRTMYTSGDHFAHRTMVTQLITHERIETTLPRAKELRRLADQVVTLGKQVCKLERG